MSNAIKSQSIVPRLDGIMRDIEKLRALSDKSFDEYKTKGDDIALTQFYLRRALEGIFHIGSHILARLNGGRATEYKEIAKKLGEYKVVGSDFADNQLVKMAGYRNRLTHFYADISDKEIYIIAKDNLDDIEYFVSSVNKLLKDPKKFNLEVE